MDDTPVVLGINRTRHASICLMHGSQLAWAIQKERLTRRKHHRGKPGDLRDHYLPRPPGLGRPVDIVVECFSSDEETGRLPVYEEELAATLALAHGSRRARISHHLALLYSVFHPSPFDEAAVMVIWLYRQTGAGHLCFAGGTALNCSANERLLRALLAGFEVRTGVPVLLDTSFKGKDEPIVETPFEAVAAFRRMPLHALAIPPFLVTRRSAPELPI